MQTGKTIEGLFDGDSQNSCSCTEQLIEKMNKNRVACLGIMGAIDKAGRKLIGLQTITRPKLVGSKPSIGLVKFNFCPFCGDKLIQEENDNAPSLHSQN